ncbi:MAG TPA: VOC family protein [Ktedonobacteraceae bacterium]|nr:VOC family protein [Ktedonobacteraceae bacterium]
MEHMAHDQKAFKGIAITQIGVVVRDVKKMVEIYHRTLGWGPWNIYIAEPPLLHSTMLRGKPTEFTFINAETHVGPVDFEFIQPLEGPSIYREFLEQHGEGVHHIACMGTGSNYEENLENFAQMGLTPLMSGAIGDSIKFYYLESEPLLKIVLESGSGHMISIKPHMIYP